MIKVVLNVDSTITDYEISNMETLAKFQALLTEEVVKKIKTEPTEDEKAAIIREYLEDVENGHGLYDFVEDIENNMPRVFDEIVERALRDTDYDTIDEITDALDNCKSALSDIYDIAREWAY